MSWGLMTMKKGVSDPVYVGSIFSNRFWPTLRPVSLSYLARGWGRLCLDPPSQHQSCAAIEGWRGSVSEALSCQESVRSLFATQHQRAVYASLVLMLGSTLVPGRRGCLPAGFLACKCRRWLCCQRKTSQYIMAGVRPIFFLADCFLWYLVRSCVCGRVTA